MLDIQVVSTNYAPERTGIAPYATSLAEGLASKGHRVSVLTAAPHYPNWAIWPSGQWRTEERRAAVHVRRFSSYVPAAPNFINRVLFEVGFGLKFAARVRRSADVLLLVSPPLFAGLVVRLWMRLTGQRVPTVLWIQDLYGVGVKETPGRASQVLGTVITFIERWLARSSEHVVLIHDRFHAVAEQHLRLDPSRVAVIRNWTHVTPTSEVDREAVRTALGWSASETVVLHAGNMGAKQGLDNVVEAARLAEAQELPIRFVLLGDGNQRASIEEAARGCARLQIMDPLPDEDFVRALAAADVLLVNERPSQNEAAVPSKLTTYFATGRPVVAATDAASATADEVRLSRAGRVVPPARPELLLAEVMRVAREWSEEDAKAGPDFVRDTLSLSAGVDAFEALLGSVARPDRSTPDERKT